MPGPGIILRELRAEFLTASVLPVAVSTAIARYETGAFDPMLLLLTLAGTVLLHLGTNTANDYFDHLSGNDQVNTSFVRPFTGGSRLIQEKLITPGAVLTISLCCFAGGAAVGIVLAVMRGWIVLALGLFGLASGYFYTAPPVRLAHRGLGEITVGLNFGLLIGIGTYYVQTGTVSAGAVACSLPLALLVTSIILINEFQDREADAAVGKRTLVVRAGTAGAVTLYGAVSLLAYAPIIAVIAARLAPLVVLVAMAPAPLVLRAIAVARARHDRPQALAPANALTIGAHAATGVLLAISYVIAS